MSRACAILIVACVLSGCGGEVELKPELQAQLDEYEALIAHFESQFAAARGDRARFADVADAYSRRIQEWMQEWSSLAPTLSDEEGAAVKASIDRLNRRAERMLRGG